MTKLKKIKKKPAGYDTPSKNNLGYIPIPGQIKKARQGLSSAQN